MSRRDNDPNRRNRSVPLSWFNAADALGLNDDEDDAQRDADVAEVVRAASVMIHAKKKRDIDRLATMLANTRPNDEGTEGEWAIRLYEAGVRPPALRP